MGRHYPLDLLIPYPTGARVRINEHCFCTDWIGREGRIEHQTLSGTAVILRVRCYAAEMPVLTVCGESVDVLEA